MALYIKSSGPIQEIIPKNGTDFSLEELQGMVGGYIQIVNLSDGRLMIINEEGLMYRLPRNPRATVLCDGVTILGDVLVITKDQVK